MRASPRSIESPVARAASVAILALALATSLAACKRGGADGKSADGKEKTEQAEAVPVEVARVSDRTMVASYTGTGSLEARSQATVTARASGIIKRVYFDVGSVVRAGQPLAQLDSERLRLTLSQTQAQMNKLEANYRRAQQLVKDQMVSANDVDEIRFNLANARAQYEAAKLELSYAVVTAPISGVVSNRPALIKPGNLVQFGQDVATIRRWLQAHVQVRSADTRDLALHIDQSRLRTQQVFELLGLRIIAEKILIGADTGDATIAAGLLYVRAGRRAIDRRQSAFAFRTQIDQERTAIGHPAPATTRHAVERFTCQQAGVA